MRIVAFVMALALAGIGPSWAQDFGGAPVIDAPSAQGLPGAGGLIVDIRTPTELRATGTPKGARHVPLQGDDMTFNPQFVQEVTAAAGDKARPIALLDANGQRSIWASKLLTSRGFSNVFAVGEGILGGNLGPGWKARGLPLVTCGECKG